MLRRTMKRERKIELEDDGPCERILRPSYESTYGKEGSDYATWTFLLRWDTCFQTRWLYNYCYPPVHSGHAI